jgi:hypothetical protein
MDELVTVVVAFMEMLPEPQRRLALAVIAILASLYTTGAFWAGVRWGVAKWIPAAREPGWFAALDLIMQVITMSSSRVSQRSLPKDQKP